MPLIINWTVLIRYFWEVKLSRILYRVLSLSFWFYLNCGNCCLLLGKAWISSVHSLFSLLKASMSVFYQIIGVCLNFLRKCFNHKKKKTFLQKLLFSEKVFAAKKKKKKSQTKVFRFWNKGISDRDISFWVSLFVAYINEKRLSLYCWSLVAGMSLNLMYHFLVLYFRRRNM